MQFDEPTPHRVSQSTAQRHRSRFRAASTVAAFGIVGAVGALAVPVAVAQQDVGPTTTAATGTSPCTGYAPVFVAIDRPQATPGSTIVISGVLAPNASATVVLRIGGVDTSLTSVTADATGAFVVTATLPAGIAPGPAQIVVSSPACPTPLQAEFVIIAGGSTTTAGPTTTPSSPTTAAQPQVLGTVSDRNPAGSSGSSNASRPSGSSGSTSGAPAKNSNQGGLAWTGTSAGGLARVALALLTLGSGFIVWRRRREHTHPVR